MQHPAFSTETKAEGTTSRLLAAADAAVNAQPTFKDFIDRIEDTHLDIIYTMLKTHALREEVRAHACVCLCVRVSVCVCVRVCV